MKKKIALYIENPNKQRQLCQRISELKDKPHVTVCSSRQDVISCLDGDYDAFVLDTENTFGIPDRLVVGGENMTTLQLLRGVRKLLQDTGAEEETFSVDSLLNVINKKLEKGVEYTDDQVITIINNTLLQHCPTFSESKRSDVATLIFNIMRREDVITDFLKDEKITEIMVNGTDKIYVEKQGKLICTDVNFSSEQRLRNLITRIVSAVGRQVDESCPIVDARLSDGSRVNAVLSPTALNGPILTIRKFPAKPIELHDLIENGTITEEAAGFLVALIKAKYNVFISGGTGTGKTTLLNICSNYINPDERVITIEDSAELQIKHIKNLVRLETRNAGVDSRSKITIRDLIRASLRMRPDRIIVGEVRNEEAIDMLQAMNTGHDGSLSTGHANSGTDMLRRLETMVCSERNIPVFAIRSQIESALDIVVHLQRVRDKSRKVMEISEVDGFSENGEIRLVPLFAFSAGEEGRLIRTENKLKNKLKFEMSGISCDKWQM